MNKKNTTKDNIVLIGMPACGKSTVGVILAKILGMDFVDTDIMIQNKEGARLNQIISERGVNGFMECEEQALLGIDTSHTVIATGGSAVYSDAGMRQLSENSMVVYLKAELPELKKRLDDLKERGVVFRAGESFEEMYAERAKLYEKYADFTVSEAGESVEDTVKKIMMALRPDGEQE